MGLTGELPEGVDYRGCSWPGWVKNSAEQCAREREGVRCHRAGRAVDPRDMKLLCAQCWSEYTVSLKDQAVKELRGITDDLKDDTPMSERPICKFFGQGICRFGSKCWYRHPET